MRDSLIKYIYIVIWILPFFLFSQDFQIDKYNSKLCKNGELFYQEFNGNRFRVDTITYVNDILLVHCAFGICPECIKDSMLLSKIKKEGKLSDRYTVKQFKNKHTKVLYINDDDSNKYSPPIKIITSRSECIMQIFEKVFKLRKFKSDTNYFEIYSRSQMEEILTMNSECINNYLLACIEEKSNSIKSQTKFISNSLKMTLTNYQKCNTKKTLLISKTLGKNSDYINSDNLEEINVGYAKQSASIKYNFRQCKTNYFSISTGFEISEYNLSVSSSVYNQVFPDVVNVPNSTNTDYTTYSLVLKDTSIQEEYKINSFSIPIGVSYNYSISNNMDLFAGATYKIAFLNKLNYFKAEGTIEQYLEGYESPISALKEEYYISENSVSSVFNPNNIILKINNLQAFEFDLGLNYKYSDNIHFIASCFYEYTLFNFEEADKLFIKEANSYYGILSNLGSLSTNSYGIKLGIQF